MRHQSDCGLLSALELSLIVFLGLSSNIFFGLVLSLPIFMLLSRGNNFGRDRSWWLLTVFWLLLFLIFISRLHRFNAGTYATAYDATTLKINLEYYFGSVFVAILWLASTMAGLLFFMTKNRYFPAWLFLASIIFILPFAFLTQQRYINYALLTYLFWCLGYVFISKELFGEKSSITIAGVICLIGFLYSSSYIRTYTEHPIGSYQRKVVDNLISHKKDFGKSNTLCFGETSGLYHGGPVATTLREEWTRLADGFSFVLLVDYTRRYLLDTTTENCDLKFRFVENGLEIVN
jgi:hypothetical protein